MRLAGLFAIALVATACGCAASGVKPALMPLTDANLQAAGKQCHIRRLGIFWGQNAIWVSGLSAVGDEPDFDAQVACLRRLIEIPSTTTVVIG